jgi:hypothetical protein
MMKNRWIYLSLIAVFFIAVVIVCTERNDTTAIEPAAGINKEAMLKAFVDNLESAGFTMDSEYGVEAFKKWLTANEKYVANHLRDDTDLNRLWKINNRITSLETLHAFLHLDMPESGYDYYVNHILSVHLLESDSFSFSHEQLEYITILSNMNSEHFQLFYRIRNQDGITLKEIGEEMKNQQWSSDTIQKNGAEPE